MVDLRGATTACPRRRDGRLGGVEAWGAGGKEVVGNGVESSEEREGVAVEEGERERGKHS